MAVNRKQKGARFERSLASKLRDYGYNKVRRAAPGIHIEAKHQETMRLYDWMAQAKRDASGSGKLPAVFHKKNNAETLVTMELDDWMNIYREWEAGMDLKGRECDEQGNTGTEGA